MNTSIENFRGSSTFRSIDIHLAVFLAAKADESLTLPEREVLQIIVMLLSFKLAAGDVCVSLDMIGGRRLGDITGADDNDCCAGVMIPGSGELAAILKKSGIAGVAGSSLPLVLDDYSCLYFHKSFTFEKMLAEDAGSFAAKKTFTADLGRQSALFRELFPVAADETDWQGVAAYSALAGGLTVITGGPGTGKTSTVVKILALAASEAVAEGRGVSIVLAAPTGKAAARLRESVSSALSALPVPDKIKNLIPAETFTLHRLLGYVRNSHEFIHNRENPLPHDVVVVDECSMGDMALMCRLVRAVRPEARLILLGDRDQLSSVEGGAVFGDLCGPSDRAYTGEFISGAEKHFGISIPEVKGVQAGLISNSVVRLTRSWRFSGDSGIGRFAELVRGGDADGAVSLLKDGGCSDIRLVSCSSTAELAALYRDSVSGILSGGVTSAVEKTERLITGFSILTAVRRGELGVEGVNLMAESVLFSLGAVNPRGRFYPGRPVLISKNDYQLNLYNGDIGITSEDCDEVIFRSPDGSEFSVHPSRLPEHQTAFAMTIHKSQGSEFDTVLVVLPGRTSPLLTRELLYTAVTRARRNVVIAADENTIRRMVLSPAERVSGLKRKLWGSI